MLLKEGTSFILSFELFSDPDETGVYSDTNWHTMMFFIRNAISQAQESPSEVGRELLSRTRKVFRDLADKDKKERGYLLGLLEMAKLSEEQEEGRSIFLRRHFLGFILADVIADEFFRMVLRYIADVPIASILIEYFETFGSKMCFFDDVQPYLGIVSTPALSIYEHVLPFIEKHEELVRRFYSLLVNFR